MHGIVVAAVALVVAAVPAFASPAHLEPRWKYAKYFDIQGHRGARGHISESTLPAMAIALEEGVTTLEMDAGLTKDGHLVMWHDESFDPLKCKDTAPVTADDPMYPYVGKWLANLTLSQVRTLDCGSLRLTGFPLALTAPQTQLSTLKEMFNFVKCATDEPVLFNIESKVNADFRNLTRSPQDFAQAFVDLFTPMGPAMVDRITHQSFDWRAIVASKRLDPTLRTSALCDDTTLWPNLPDGNWGNLTTHGDGPSNWLNGINIDALNGTIGERVAYAAHSIDADFISPSGISYASTDEDITQEGFIEFTTKSMVDKAHELGLLVKPWTVNRLSNIEHLVDVVGVDGIITDYPRDVRAWAEQEGLKLPPRGDKKRIAKCLAKHHKTV